MKPKKLTKKEIKKLQKQFPINKQELERLKQNKKARLQNKIEMIVIVFGIAMILLFLYIAYLMVTYQW